jgi:hypothetical protein
MVQGLEVLTGLLGALCVAAYFMGRGHGEDALLRVQAEAMDRYARDAVRFKPLTETKDCTPVADLRRRVAKLEEEKKPTGALLGESVDLPGGARAIYHRTGWQVFSATEVARAEKRRTR